MSVPLILMIERLEHDQICHDNTGPHKVESSKPKSWSGILSSFKPKPITKDPPNFISVPLTYNEDDYLNWLIVQDFVQPTSTMSVQEAVSRMIETFANYGHNIRSVGTFIITMAEQIPYWHPSQLKLARLLWTLGRSEERLRKIKPVHCPEQTIDQFYQDLKEDMTENEADPGSESEADQVIYVNYQAFLANVHALEVWEASPEPAIWAMKRAFKPKLEPWELDMADYYVMGAAQWVVWNGQGLFKMILQHDADASTWTATSFDEKSPPEIQQLTLELWESWKNEFDKAGDDEKVGAEARNLAMRAAATMQGLQRTMQF
ncbi:hypothetical protein GLAREA_06610 [Glarea lozoyensis ATCC 20868]|uniref:Uncharacterized protein n=1 Tax=Glarea lozoyensis (strain ATCC 20868 / MF5171) TaxID=1116229 RepID=S3D557_GLAL2|nr:uncharacterized protein GLAREA_06610 [Glarea lozoyensis ATCC 20868]EPE33597.1 hypothetical protein GLAREA_06610 [Glarea lozoyensis ATCC 20868]